MKCFRTCLLWSLTLVNTTLLVYLLFPHSDEEVIQPLPDLVGTWSGNNQTVSDLKGYRYWGEKTIRITEQKDRRFRGQFTYADGTKNFFGVIYPDNRTFTWVASNSRGYNHGRILGKDHISACYVESWEEATAGCADLYRQSE